MNPQDFLQSYSELAIAIIGFSGIVLAVKGISNKENPLQNIATSMLVGFGGISLVAAILPQILLKADVPNDITWQVMSTLILSTQLLGGYYRTKQAKEVGAGFQQIAGRAVQFIMVVILLVAAANLYFAEFWVYMIVLLAYLVVSILIFSSLVQSRGTDA